MADKEEIEIVEIEGCPEWMLTMGDCMSLLLCFFVMMLAFSTPNAEKLMDVLAGMQGALGIIPPVMREKGVSVYKDSAENEDDKVVHGETEEIGIPVDRVSPVDLRSMAIVNKFNTFQNRLVELGFKNHVDLEQIDEGIRMTVEFDKVFRRGSEQMLSSGKRLFESFANLINVGANEVRLTAGLDSPNSVRDRAFSHEWRLSNRRAGVIGDMFHEKFKISPTRFSFGTQIVPATEKAKLEVLIVEKIELTQEVTMDELMDINKEL